RQELILWTGEIRSHFTLEGIPVEVSTFAHPDIDEVAFHIRSPLILGGRLHIWARFPYPNVPFADDGDDRGHPLLHHSGIISSDSRGAVLRHDLDTTRYFV